MVGILVGLVLAWSEITNWVNDHIDDLGMFLAAAAVIFVILVIVDRVSRGLENWVRSSADTAGPLLRSFGALTSMVILGPVFGWPLFRILGYSRRFTYALTLLAAPVFGGIWVPFYGLGVWGLIGSWF